MNAIISTEELDGLSDSKAAQIKAIFQPMIKTLEDFEVAYNELMATEQTNEKSEKANTLRLKISKVRIEAEKARKSLKAECLREGRAIDGTSNIFKYAMCDKEEKLREIETFYERIEEERITRIQGERESELAKYDVITNDPHLGVMSADVWINYLAGVRLNHQAVKEAERKAEEERVEAEHKKKVLDARNLQIMPYAHMSSFGEVGFDVDINTTQEKFDEILSFLQNKQKEHEDEQARIKLENEKLKAEQVIMEKEQKEREAELAKEREERRQIEAEQAIMEKSRAEEERKLAMASDKEKLIKFAELLYYDDNTFKSEEANVAMFKAGAILIAAATKMG